MAEYIGTVSTRKVGSESEFEFEVDDDEMEEARKREESGDQFAVRDLINTSMMDAMWGMDIITVDWKEVE